MSETATGFNTQASLRDLRLAERAYENRVVELANTEAANVIAAGGVTCELDQFTLAMFGRIGMTGLDTKDNTKHFVELDAAINDNYDVPVGVFVPYFTGVSLQRVGYAPRRGRFSGGDSPLSYKFQETNFLFQPGLRAVVGLLLRDVHSAAYNQAENITRSPENEVRLAVVERSYEFIANGYDDREQIAIGWEAIFAMHGLGRAGAHREDDAFLKLVTQARSHFAK